ncbi:helix-turn-helix domain-containing protein [Acinetobacter junii]|jgi:transcriptional regulator with XRE-family HTH domain|uniref:helix-turn-helix domain-containing protein n=1 Tax=Acinetobacter junii TaxID=40215 RepID=UPI00125EAAB2|nr:helix-turn-helix transcriptional regulator [Acinetobacter junii]MCU4406474.1 helix-turn-helix domain-containing protein [Acinetobacter junii]
MNKAYLLSCKSVDMSIVKMEQIASHLVGLLRHSNMSRAELAAQLGWKKSRVTKVLSGDENLTIKTITAITQQLGYDFDVVFHNKNYEKPKQPWQVDREKLLSKSIFVNANRELKLALEFQTGAQVVDAVLSGNESDFYISINPSHPTEYKEVISVTPQIETESKSISVIYQHQETFKEAVCYE